ncbi:MAG: CRISPR-associated endonuclease Cas2 [Candidatus Methylomirabilales bacterium]
MGPEVQTYVIYDIQDDRVRYRIANVCKDYGLARVQFSAFAGPLNANKREELFLRLCRDLGEHQGKVLVLPVCEKDEKAKRELIIHEEPKVLASEEPV